MTGYVPLNQRPEGGHARLLRLVPAPCRVLDVGCSTGYLARPLVDRGCTVVGVELDPAAAELARAVCEEVIVGDVEVVGLPLEAGSFDVVLCGDLVEHLRDPEAFLRRVRGLLVPSGRVILTTPNVANWAMRLSLLAGRWQYSDRGILDRTHVHLFTRRSLRQTLVRAGYDIVVFDHTAPVPYVGTPVVERLAHGLARIRPSLLAYQFVVSAVPR